MSINSFAVSGRLGKKPMLKKFPDGRQVAEFTLAFHRSSKDRATGERQQVTDWYSCNYWGPLAERLCGEAIRGQAIFVSGSLALEPLDSGKVLAVITVDRYELGRLPAKEEAGA